MDYYKTSSAYVRTLHRPLVRLDYKLIEKEPVLFLKPQDWMNSSGRTVGLVKRVCDVKPSNIMVVYDDMDFDFGCIKIKHTGSSGRHNGVQSVIDAIGKDFARFRVGIGRPEEGCTARDHVLSDFRTFEQKQFCDLYSLAIQVINTYIAHDVQKTMEIFNRR